jgi:hypothetical protein
VGIQEVALEHLVGVALVVMEGVDMEGEEGEEEDMEEIVVMVAVAMEVIVDQDTAVVQVVHTEGMASMVEEQGDQEDHSQGVMKVKATGR